MVGSRRSLTLRFLFFTFNNLAPGGSFPFTIGRIEHGHTVRPDLCAVDNHISPRKYLGSFYTDSLVHDPVALKLLIDVIGKVRLHSLSSIILEEEEIEGSPAISLQIRKF